MLITRNHSLSVSVKMSVESVVETVISRYERHFNKSRNLDEEQAMDEMEISENLSNYFQSRSISENFHGLVLEEANFIRKVAFCQRKFSIYL